MFQKKICENIFIQNKIPPSSIVPKGGSLCFRSEAACLKVGFVVLLHVDNTFAAYLAKWSVLKQIVHIFIFG